MSEAHFIFLDALTDQKATVRMRALKNQKYTDWDVLLYGIPENNNNGNTVFATMWIPILALQFCIIVILMLHVYFTSTIMLGHLLQYLKLTDYRVVFSILFSKAELLVAPSIDINYSVVFYINSRMLYFWVQPMELLLVNGPSLHSIPWHLCKLHQVPSAMY